MEKNLVYSYKNEGTYMPHFDCYEIYEDGTFIYNEGDIYDEKDRRSFQAKIPPNAVEKIIELIKENPRVFIIDRIEQNECCVNDADYTTFVFSYKQSKNKIRVYALDFYPILKKEGFVYKDALLLIKLEKKIRDILKENGIDVEMPLFPHPAKNDL